uniref:Uncharacterized protein n=1 Tax=Plectus sambesii TaxID=2011161 RepID=A0A914WFP5_9BILA
MAEGNVWFLSRQLFERVVERLNGASSVDLDDFSVDLQANRSRLLEVLKNPVKSAADRAKIEKVGDQITLPGGRSVRVDQSMSAEALILAEVFNINEIAAVDLVLAGESELPNFPGLTRGLCAVLCYYNSHRYVAQTLRCLIEARAISGSSNGDVCSLVRTFTDDLWSSGLFKRLCEAVAQFDAARELDRLQQPNVKGLGGPKHRKMVMDLLTGIQSALGDCLVMWSVQNGLQASELPTVVSNLREWESTRAFGRSELSFWAAVFFAFDTSLLDVISTEDELGMFPVATQPQFIQAIQREICELQWKDAGLRATLQMGWAVSMRSLAQHHWTQGVLEDCQEDEEDILERALDAQPFHFLRQFVVGSASFRNTELAVRAVDSLLKQLIDYFPIRIKELRSRADEELRIAQEALERGHAPSQPVLHYEQQLLTLADMYTNIDPQLRPIIAAYWADADFFPQSFISEQVKSRTNLSKFIRSGAELGPAVLHVAYLALVKSLACDGSNARNAFELLRSRHGRAEQSTASWDHFFTALRQYLYTFKRDASMTSMGFGFASHVPVVVHISPEELAGLTAWFELAERIALEDVPSRATFVDHPNWQCLDTIFGLLSSSVPLALKGVMFRFLGALACDKLAAAKVWEKLLAAKIIAHTPDGRLSGLQQELDQVECRSQQYPATSGFLHMMASLVGHGSDCLPPSDLLAPYLQFVTDSIAIKFTNRSYKDVDEMVSIFFILVTDGEQGRGQCKSLHNIKLIKQS